MEETPQRIINKRVHYGEDVLNKYFGERFRVYREQWVAAGKREILTEFPLYLQFELSPYCNLRCCSCLHGHKALREDYVKIDNLLDFKQYQKIIDEAAAYKCPSISFHNNNEPLLDKRIEEKINYAKKAGFIDIILVTNGTLLNKERAQNLLESGVTKITFSIDAYSEEVYKLNRVKSDFSLVKSNIFDFLELKKQMDSELPITRVSFVVNKNNYLEMDSFEDYWKDKVDLVDFQNFSALEGLTEHLCPPGSEKFEGFECNSPWQQVVIRANGDVLPCCSLYGPEVVLGNVVTNPIYDIWHGEKMSKLRETLLRGEFEYLACQKCAKTFYYSPAIQKQRADKS